MPKRPWPLILTLIGIVILVTAWCVYWFAAASFVRTSFESERTKLAQQNITLECKALDWGGFPFRFERDCISPSFTIQGDEVEAARLLLVLQAYMPNRAVALLDGPVTVNQDLTITHERAMASARFWGERDWQASLELPKLKASPYGNADFLLVSARDTGAETLDVALDARTADVLLGPGILLKVDAAQLTAKVPRQAIRRDILHALAKSGRKIEIASLQLAKGELVMTAKGEIGIGPAGDVAGHLTTTASRLDLLMSELKQNFGLSDKDAQTLTTMIGLLQPGKTKDVTLDLIAKDGKLYWGPVKLTNLPPVF